MMFKEAHHHPILEALLSHDSLSPNPAPSGELSSFPHAILQPLTLPHTLNCWPSLAPTPSSAVLGTLGSGPLDLADPTPGFPTELPLLAFIELLD